MEGNTIWHKTRLCAQGFQQQYGTDYKETFAPVARYDSIRVLLALVTQRNLEMSQFDVRTAFLYGELEETIHMEVPAGVEVRKREKIICKLNKSLYGLKQSPRCWNTRFDKFLKLFKFTESCADKGTV